MIDSAGNSMGSLPLAERFEALELNGRITVIAAAGFEERARRFIDLLEAPSLTVGLLDYLPTMAENRFEELKGDLESNGWDVKGLRYDRYQPGDFHFELADFLRATGADRVILDVSAMSKLAIMLCLTTCLDLNVAVDVLYTEAELYGPRRGAFDKAAAENPGYLPSIHSFTGVVGTVRIPRLASVGMQGYPLAAIAFLSFNEQLTQALINAVYPSRLLLINGTPPRLAWREAATAAIHRHLLAEWPAVDNPVDSSGLPLRKSSTLDYRETVWTLLDVYWDLATQYRIMLSPTGSKMQAVGAFIAWAMHQDIHIEYPTPKGFLHETYSEGVGESWLIRFPPLRAFIAELAALDRGRVLGVMASGPLTDSTGTVPLR